MKRTFVDDLMIVIIVVCFLGSILMFVYEKQIDMYFTLNGERQR